MKIYPFLAPMLVAGVVTFSTGNMLAEKESGVSSVAGQVSRNAPMPGRDEPVMPLGAPKPADEAMVELGKKLFFDPRLSRSGFVSCNSCHNLSMGGSDNLKTSVGHNLRKGVINTPTVLNSNINFAQFWDGRVKNFQELLSHRGLCLWWKGCIY
jgi:cytochrome c peroxidase